MRGLSCRFNCRVERRLECLNSVMSWGRQFGFGKYTQPRSALPEPLSHDPPTLATAWSGIIAAMEAPTAAAASTVGDCFGFVATGGGGDENRQLYEKKPSPNSTLLATRVENKHSLTNDSNGLHTRNGSYGGRGGGSGECGGFNGCSWGHGGTFAELFWEMRIHN